MNVRYVEMLSRNDDTMREMKYLTQLHLSDSKWPVKYGYSDRNDGQSIASSHFSFNKLFLRSYKFSITLLFKANKQNLHDLNIGLFKMKGCVAL